MWYIASVKIQVKVKDPLPHNDKDKN